MIEMNWTC